ncbi:hypothetical protein [Dactylosporangium sp. NPDC051484]|uniref:hypothetical protein n=1 Tax=Dactylosporangium sp. NPDC051484 TaxID=3154942 RepID=UPI0034508607
MHVTDTEQLEWRTVAVNARTGEVQNKYIREGEILPGVGYASDCYNYVGGANPFTAPRHRHDFEQIRISMTGDQDFGNGQVTEEGWIAYFPAAAYYGPEFINGASIFQIQWSDHWVSRSLHESTYAELSKTGRFEGGKYVTVGPDGEEHTRDALNAIWEHVYKRPSSFPPARYPQPVLMNPDAFEYQRLDDAISTKVLGRFTERDITITKIRWDETAAWTLSADRTYCVFTTTGDIVVGDQEYGSHTVVWSDWGDADQIVGQRGAEALCIAFQTINFAPDLSDRA